LDRSNGSDLLLGNNAILGGFLNSSDKRLEHIVSPKARATIEPERVFVQVALQVIPTDVMIDAPNAVLGQAPKAFDGVDVRVARDVDLGRMVDALVLVAEPFERVVNGVFIGKDGAVRHGALDNVREQGRGLGVRNDLRHNAALALNHSEHGSFADSARTEMLTLTGMFVFLQAAEMAFVHLNLAGKLRAIIFFQKRPNLLEHAPRALIGHADLAFQLFGADAAFGRGHQVNCVEPELQGRGRILKDSPLHRMLMVAAELALVRWAISFAMVLGDLLASGAINAVWIELSDKPLKASRVIGVIPLEFHQGIGAVGCARPDRTIAIDLAHNGYCSRRPYGRQGDNYPKKGPRHDRGPIDARTC
jgi:hypothetical protein